MTPWNLDQKARRNNGDKFGRLLNAFSTLSLLYFAGRSVLSIFWGV